MSLYNMLFGKNPSAEIILALIGLKENDVERFRNCTISYEDKEISIYTRTGGGNREDYPNESLVNNPYYKYDEDDDFDSTYATYYFKFPEEIELEISNLQNITKHGISGKLITWISKTSSREKTEGDIYTEKRLRHEQILKGLQQSMDVTKEFNGHTTIPLTDSGMRTILEAAEANNGEFLGSHFGVKPYNISIKFDQNDSIYGYRKIVIETDWKLDVERWNYWKEKYSAKYPKAIAKMQEGLD